MIASAESMLNDPQRWEPLALAVSMVELSSPEFQPRKAGTAALGDFLP
jgi:hypothetical protein